MKFSLTALLDFLTKDIIKEDYGNQNFRHTQRERERRILRGILNPKNFIFVENESPLLT